MLATSCAKEIGSSENPICAKSAFVFKVIPTNNDERELFRLEEVNVRFGVLKASSFQVSLNHVSVRIHTVLINLVIITIVDCLALSWCEFDVLSWIQS